MKSFYKLPVLTKNPAMGLMVEDGIPEVVDMEGYDGMRGMSEVLSWSTPASEIVELAEIAEKLNASHTGVVRTGAKAGGTCILSTNDYECLADVGRRIFAISDTDRVFASNAAGIVQRFVWMAIYDRFNSGRAWPLLAVLKSVIKNCQLAPFWPQSLHPSSEILNEIPEWWGLGPAATTEQANLFAGAVAAHCLTWESTPQIIWIVDAWLSKKQDGSVKTFDDLYNAFREEDPLAPYAG